MKEKDSLLKIKQIILDTCQPDQIYTITYGCVCPHHSIIGDFLVFVHETYPKTSYQRFEKIIEENCSQIGSVVVTIKSIDRINQLMQEHHFYTKICNPDNLIYDVRNSGCPPVPDKETIRASFQKSKQTFGMGFVIAEAILDGASYYVNSKNYAMILYMLRTACIQALNTFLSAITGYDRFTYDLTRLLRLTCRITDSIMEVFPENKDWDKQLLGLLSSVDSYVLYKNSFKVTHFETMIVFSRVYKLFNKMMDEFEKHLKDFEMILRKI